MHDAVTRFVRTADGLEIAYKVFEGSGELDLAFLPHVCGVDLMAEDPGYRRVIERFSSLGRLVCFDYRGMGGSDPVPLGGVPTPETWMEDLRAVLDAIGSESADIVASASAGFMGMLFAATYPERTKTLTLIDAYARLGQGDGQEFGAVPEAVAMTAQLMQDLWGTEDGALLATTDPDPVFRQWYARYCRHVMSRATFGALTRWNFSLDLRPIVPAIRVPTLVVSQMTPGIVDPEHSRWIANAIEDAKLVELPHQSAQFVYARESLDDLLDVVEEFVTGQRPDREPDRALATILFTDIVGSTDHASRVGDRRWGETLDQHDAVTAREVERFRGRLVKSTGDGSLAIFDGPARAIRCAHAIVKGVRQLGIEIRAGLHTGEIDIRGGDVGGIAIHIGQRISALAGPGEVLVSRTVSDLVVGSGITFEDRGQHELKGVPGTWAVLAFSLSSDTRP